MWQRSLRIRGLALMAVLGLLLAACGSTVGGAAESIFSKGYKYTFAVLSWETSEAQRAGCRG